MKCPKCKNENPNSSKFCNHCGAKIENEGKTCPNPECCRTGLPHEANYCPDCGAKLNNNQENSTDFTDDSGSFTDERDGHKYKWIRIGSQIWMAENLAYEMDEGCWIYEDKRENLRKYGYLYNWGSSNKACPKGWHLPSYGEWIELINFLIENEYFYNPQEQDSIAKALASKKDWNVSNHEGTPGNNPEDNNSTGFDAKPGGFFYSNINEYILNECNGCWWTATEYEYDKYKSVTMVLMHNVNYLYDFFDYKEFGFSVRCIKD